MALGSREPSRMWSGRALTVSVLVFGLVLNSVGNGLLSAGMRRIGSATHGWLLAAASEPHVLLGVVCQAVFFASYLYALARADLSLVLPITAIDYLLTALVAAFVLGERPPLVRWLGILLVALGVGLVIATDRGRSPAEPGAMARGEP